jgi:hypothetical protein
LAGYWLAAWHKLDKVWFVKTLQNKSYIGFNNLLDAVKVADIAAIHLGRDKINLGRDHYPPGPPRDWPKHLVPNCPALRRLIGDSNAI